jgi:hypothetical protein
LARGVSGAPQAGGSAGCARAGVHSRASAMASASGVTLCGIIFWLTRGGRRQRCTFYAQAVAAAMKKPKSAGLLLPPSSGARPLPVVIDFV